MQSKFRRTSFLSLTILFLMACSFVQTALSPATATPAPTDTATLTPIPPSPTASITPSPTDTPSPTPDFIGTQAAEMAATQAASEAQVRKEMKRLGLVADQGSLAWVGSAPVTLSTKNYGRSDFHSIADDRVFANFIFKSDVSWTSKTGLAGCGIGFRISNNDAGAASMYDFFAMRLSGMPTWDFSYYDHGRYIADLMGSTQHDSIIDISQGGTNTFVLVINENLLTAYANGKRLGTTSYDRLQSGSLAWFVSQESGETSCVFSNSWLWELPSNLPPGTPNAPSNGQSQG